MAAAAMNGAVFDSTMNVFYKMKHAKLYDSVLATPLSAGDVAVGEIGFAVVRGLLYSTAFLLTMWRSAWCSRRGSCCRSRPVC